MYKKFIAFNLLLLCAMPHMALANKPTDSKLNISHTKLSKTQIVVAKSFGLKPLEWQRYLLLKQGPAGIHNPNMHPVMMLGMYATTASKRDYYARLYAKSNYDYMTNYSKWQTSYLNAFHSQYPEAKVIDSNLVEHYRAQWQDGKFTPLPKIELLKDYRPQRGDIVALFLELNCRECEAIYQKLIVQVPKINLHLHFKRSTREQIFAWAKKVKLDAKLVKEKKVTLNHAAQEARALGVSTWPTLFKKSPGQQNFIRASLK